MADPGDVLLHQDRRSKKVSLQPGEYTVIPSHKMQTCSSQQMSPVVLKKEVVLGPPPHHTVHCWDKILVVLFALAEQQEAP